MTESPKANDADWSGLNLPVLTDVVEEPAVPVLAEEAPAAAAEVPEFDFSSELDVLAAELEIPELSLADLLADDTAAADESASLGGLDFSNLPSLELSDADGADESADGLGFVLEPLDAQPPSPAPATDLTPSEPVEAKAAEAASTSTASAEPELSWEDVVAASAQAAESAFAEPMALDMATPEESGEAASHSEPSPIEEPPAFTSISIDSLPSGVLGGGVGREPAPAETGLEWLSSLPKPEIPPPSQEQVLQEAERVLADERAMQDAGQAAAPEVGEAIVEPEAPMLDAPLVDEEAAQPEPVAFEEVESETIASFDMPVVDAVQQPEPADAAAAPEVGEATAEPAAPMPAELPAAEAAAQAEAAAAFEPVEAEMIASFDMPVVDAVQQPELADAAAAPEVGEATAEPAAPMPAELPAAEAAAQPEPVATFEPVEIEAIESSVIPLVTDTLEPEPVEVAAVPELSEAIVEPEAPVLDALPADEAAAQSEPVAAFEPVEADAVESFDIPLVADELEPEPAEVAAVPELSEAIVEPEAPMPAELPADEAAAQSEPVVAFEPAETEAVESFDIPLVADVLEPELLEVEAAQEVSEAAIKPEAPMRDAPHVDEAAAPGGAAVEAVEDEDLPALSGLLGGRSGHAAPEAVQPPAGDAPVSPALTEPGPVAVVKIAAMAAAGSAGRGPAAQPFDEQALFNSLYEQMLPRMKVELSLWLQEAVEVQAKQMLSGMMHQLKEDYEMLFGDALKESLRQALGDVGASMKDGDGHG
ncbi:hypothetical protein [Chromobacterium subtsugae]|uniref:hypothetical protein n=1 Tax=Chromobacterium subtsugae TaxID=251747 RepID=UPI0006994FA0|nr:hypothetical protein [Chromobacterium subtsugae]